MTTRAEQLIKLAETRFELSAPELKLLQKVSDGRTAKYQTLLKNPADASEWEQGPTLRSSLIVWLCQDPEARSFLTQHGISVVGAKIMGRLNLEFASLEVPLVFLSCRFTDIIRLDRAKIKFLDLSGSYVAASKIYDAFSDMWVISSLEGGSIQVESDVMLSNGFQATGRVLLSGATIGGSLNCSRGTFRNPDGIALFAQSVEIEGNVIMSNGFHATGGVSMYGATIGGVLDCHNGTIESSEVIELFHADAFDSDAGVELFYGGSWYIPNWVALIAQSAKIKGSVFLCNGFQATGRVLLQGATIGGDLDCSNGQFHNPEGVALIAQSIEVKGNVFLRNGFQAIGRVSLQGATIGGILDCHNGICTTLDLRFAKILTLADQKDGWPEKNHLFLDGLVYDKIDSNSPLDSTSRLQWLQRQPQDVFSPQPYEQLAQVLQVSGHESAAIAVLIGKQEDRRHHIRYKLNDKWNEMLTMQPKTCRRLAEFPLIKDNSVCRLAINWFGNWFLGITIAHGYRPHRALLFSLGFVVIGTVLFSWGYSRSPKLISPSHVETFEPSLPSNPKPISDDYPRFNPLFYSLDTFIPIMDLHQKSYWLPNANRGSEIPLIVFKCKTGSLLRYYFWLHIVWGWIFTSLWVAGFTGLVRRLK